MRTGPPPPRRVGAGPAGRDCACATPAAVRICAAMGAVTPRAPRPWTKCRRDSRLARTSSTSSRIPCSSITSLPDPWLQALQELEHGGIDLGDALLLGPVAAA